MAETLLSALAAFVVFLLVMRLFDGPSSVTRHEEWFPADNGDLIKAVVEARPDGYGRIIDTERFTERPRLYLVESQAKSVDMAQESV